MSRVQGSAHSAPSDRFTDLGTEPLPPLGQPDVVPQVNMTPHAIRLVHKQHLNLLLGDHATIRPTWCDTACHTFRPALQIENSSRNGSNCLFFLIRPVRTPFIPPPVLAQLQYHANIHRTNISDSFPYKMSPREKPIN